MIIPSKEIVESIKNRYKPGMRIKCIHMDDPYHAVPDNSLGTIDMVDDIGTIFVKWDCGSRLGLAYPEDKYEIVKE